MRQEIINKFVSAALSAIQRGVFSFRFLNVVLFIISRNSCNFIPFSADSQANFK